MDQSRSKKLEDVKEKRLLNRIAIGIILFGLILGLVFFFSGRKIENEVKNKKIETSENNIDKLDVKFQQELAKINQDELNNEQKSNIDGIKTLILGFKGAEVNDSLLNQLSIKIEKLSNYPQQ